MRTINGSYLKSAISSLMSFTVKKIRGVNRYQYLPKYKKSSDIKNSGQIPNRKCDPRCPPVRMSLSIIGTNFPTHKFVCAQLSRLTDTTDQPIMSPVMLLGILCHTLTASFQSLF